MARKSAATTTTAKTKAAADPDEIRDRIRAIEGELNAAVLERNEAVRSLLLALLTRQHLLLLGPPGTAKSLLTDLAQCVLEGAERFATLLTRTSTPDELFGMWDVSLISAGRVERLDAGGTMRSAHIAFLDECFKANSTTLNALLGALNERKFRNGTAGETKIPLVSCVGASNEYPQGDDLGALYDRFLLRHWIPPVQEESSWLDLLTGGARPAPQTRLTLDELAVAQAEVAAVQIPQGIGQVLLTIRSALAQAGVTASDRRWRQSMDVVRAQAWFAGRAAADKADLLVLQHVLWGNAQEEGRKVAEVLLELCAPRLKELLSVMDLAYEQIRLLREYSHRSDVTRGEVSEAKGKFSSLLQQASELIPDAGPPGQEQAERLARLQEEAARLHAKAVW